MAKFYVESCNEVYQARRWAVYIDLPLGVGKLAVAHEFSGKRREWDWLEDASAYARMLNKDLAEKLAENVR